MAPTENAGPETAAAELAQAVGQILRRLRSEATSSELNLSEDAVLARLDAQGPLSTAQLARAESMKPQSMGTVLAGLERARLVRREPHPTDGRQVLFVLAEKGVEVRRRRRSAKRAWLAEALAKLEPAERQILVAAIPILARIGQS